MQAIDNYKFKLYTEEELENICDNKPALRDHTFKGYCIQTQKSLLYGPEAQNSDRCLNCYPNSHFYLVPLKLLGSEETIEEKQPGEGRTSAGNKPKYITLVKS